MDIAVDVVIVGAGIAGLTTSLGLYSLRSTGFALTLWTNAWRALDAVGVGDSLRQQHFQIQGLHESLNERIALFMTFLFMLYDESILITLGCDVKEETMKFVV
ncbi:monooxygenase 2 [Quercus suber]|uniref:Monooxygenase 2 n=1 Tax=Quercus suber TaxID=58331 RepID=A0AAW0M6T4_QUESU